jgi:hypothetical protein
MQNEEKGNDIEGFHFMHPKHAPSTGYEYITGASN